MLGLGRNLKQQQDIDIIKSILIGDLDGEKIKRITCTTELANEEARLFGNDSSSARLTYVRIFPSDLHCFISDIIEFLISNSFSRCKNFGKLVERRFE